MKYIVIPADHPLLNIMSKFETEEEAIAAAELAASENPGSTQHVLEFVTKSEAEQPEKVITPAVTTRTRVRG